MKQRTRIGAVATLAAALFVAGALGVTHSGKAAVQPGVVQVAGPAAKGGLVHVAGASLEQTISDLQLHLKSSPNDHVSWSTLGLAYVQQAKVTVNSDFYPLAEGVLNKSLGINKDDNFLAYAGLSALASARHDFLAARTFAEQGLKIDRYSAILYGALSDAQTQLGDYDAAFASVQKMVDLSPDTSSLARASYSWELRGDIAKAQEFMQRAADDAPNGTSRAFALIHLGELTFNDGDANAALNYYLAALQAAPGDPAALAGKARAAAALGQTMTALDAYAEVVQRAPEPSYIVDYGELLQSVGRISEAAAQYSVFETTQKLFEANGVVSDTTSALFYANHGDPARALRDAEAGIASRPFLATYDAYAWALHQNGRDKDALVAIDKALSLGTRSALFHFHAGMIKNSLGDLAGARSELALALAINPTFSPLDAPVAVSALAQLESSV